jgi:GntR family transcriptional regulator
MDRYLCLRVADAIHREIENGTLPPGAKVPTRQELATEHYAHIHTVGYGLRILEDEGLIWRCPGLGYYVSRLASSSSPKRSGNQHQADIQ